MNDPVNRVELGGDGINIIGKFVPMINNQPVCINIDDCEDLFVLIFSSEESCRSTTIQILKNLNIDGAFIIGKLKSEEVILTIMKTGTRVMLDPEIVNMNHTKWTELIKC